VGRVYAASWSQSFDGPNTDIFFMSANSSTKFALLSYDVHINETDGSTAKVALVRRSTDGSGGTSRTVYPIHQDNTVSSGVTLVSGRTTVGTESSELRTFYQQGFMGLRYQAIRKNAIIVNPSGRLALELVDSLGSSQTIVGTAVWEEF
jgi:hypothetical protein